MEDPVHMIEGQGSALSALWCGIKGGSGGSRGSETQPSGSPLRANGYDGCEPYNKAGNADGKNRRHYTNSADQEGRYTGCPEYAAARWVFMLPAPKKRQISQQLTANVAPVLKIPVPCDHFGTGRQCAGSLRLERDTGRTDQRPSVPNCETSVFSLLERSLEARPTSYPRML